MLTCESLRGVCSKCYGRNMATGKMVKLGEAGRHHRRPVIGEPGTQLTMRKFHVGGTATQTFKQPIIKVKNDGEVRFHDFRSVQSLEGSFIVLTKNGAVTINGKGRS